MDSCAFGGGDTAVQHTNWRTDRLPRGPVETRAHFKMAQGERMHDKKMDAGIKKKTSKTKTGKPRTIKSRINGIQHRSLTAHGVSAPTLLAPSDRRKQSQKHAIKSVVDTYRRSTHYKPWGKALCIGTCNMIASGPELTQRPAT